MGGMTIQPEESAPSNSAPAASDPAVPAPKETKPTPQDATKPGGSKPAAKDQLVIRGFSKVIFLWPTAAVSLLFFFLAGGFWIDPMAGGSAEANQENLNWLYSLGLWWMVVFALNLLVFTYDFGRANFITFVSIVVLVVLGLTVWDGAVGGGVWSGLRDFFGSLKIQLNAYFYLCMGVLLSIFLGLAWLSSRFESWTISSNELIHKHGFLGDVRAYSTIHMHVEKEIPDVFEWILFGSGRLIFKPGNAVKRGEEMLVVNHVFRINQAEKKVKQYLSSLEVQ